MLRDPIADTEAALLSIQRGLELMQKNGKSPERAPAR